MKIIENENLESTETSYILIKEGKKCDFILDITNSLKTQQILNLTAEFIPTENSLLIEENSSKLQLDSLEPSNSTNFVWEFKIESISNEIETETSEILIELRRGNVFLDEISFTVRIERSLKISVNLFVFIGLIFVFSSGYWTLRKKG